MIPTIDILLNELTEDTHHSNTYRAVRVGDRVERIDGYTDGLNAIKQTIYFILNTERYQFPIYSWDFGVELLDLYGQPMPYVMSEVPRRVTEALTQDDRIVEVKDFEFEINKHILHTTFNVVTNIGTLPTELEVTI